MSRQLPPIFAPTAMKGTFSLPPGDVVNVDLTTTVAATNDILRLSFLGAKKGDVVYAKFGTSDVSDTGVTDIMIPAGDGVQYIKSAASNTDIAFYTEDGDTIKVNVAQGVLVAQAI